MAKTKQAEPDLDLEDLDLEDLDMEDLEDIDLGDETEDEETEDSEDLDLEDDDEDEEVEEDEDDDEDELDLEDEDEPEASDDDDFDLDDEDEEPEPPKRTRKAPAKAQSNGDAPLSDAQRTLLAKAVKSKRGYVKYTVPGQVRTVNALIERGLVKKHGGKGSIAPTARGRKEIEKGSVSSTSKAPAKAAKATQAPAKRRGRPKGSTGATSPRELPKGRYGIADVAKAAGGAPEPTVRRVLDLNSDEFDKENGRWAFTKADATKLAKKVKLYVKHTGGKRGRPKGSTNRLPDGKVGVSGIADQAGVSQQTVYVWLRAHNAKVKKFKQDGSWAFPEKVAKQIASRLS